MEPVLRDTYGTMVYQEQVMRLAQVLGGMSLNDADGLRKAMGKKKAEEMMKQQASFISGAVKKGVAEEKARAIFAELEGFASYGFNKSHSAAYALITYQSAWLKAHYPTEFFAAALTTDKDKVDKVVRLVAEARAWGCVVLPPDVNASETDFSVVYAHPNGDGTTRGTGKVKDRYGPRLRFGLGAVRGVGESALETMFDARRAGGPFSDLFDFATRVDAKRLNKGVLEALVQCGAFDGVLLEKGITRARAYAAVDRALERSRNASRDRERGQTEESRRRTRPRAAATRDGNDPERQEQAEDRGKHDLECEAVRHAAHGFEPDQAVSVPQDSLRIDKTPTLLLVGRDSTISKVWNGALLPRDEEDVLRNIR